MIFRVKMFPNKMKRLAEKLRKFLESADDRKRIEDVVEVADEIERLALVLDLCNWDRKKVLRDK